MTETKMIGRMIQNDGGLVKYKLAGETHGL